LDFFQATEEGNPLNTHDHEKEVTSGQRFQFGKNWRSFLDTIDDARIREAERSLQEMLEVESLEGKTFLDVGSGSGLFSLAARRLGAHVHSFDFDPQSVACTRELKHRYFPSGRGWTVDEASILDTQWVESLGTFDVVYAWGVLHHTGSMWAAMDNTCRLVSSGGVLFVAIYNDQGRLSDFWRAVKQLYCSSAMGKIVVCSTFLPLFASSGLASDLLKLRNPLLRYREYKKSRGMSRIHDWLDWLGGYPFEVADPQAVINFCSARELRLHKLKTAGRHLGNNQFIFLKRQARTISTPGTRP
jgi:2-polyprenyl-6-hydroxyphenyl methylase/3-demethylubiquinone-9 3-methyltransferase